MRIFAIRDEENRSGKDLAYLLYYKAAKTFYIEMPENADPWEVPLLLSSFAARGEYTLGAFWSRLWVEQRIVPPDRQNLGQILRTHHLKEYDEYSLLMIASGRCAQDSYYLKEVSPADCPKEIRERWKRKILDILPLAARETLVFFKNGVTKRCGIAPLVKNDARFRPVLEQEELFCRAEVQPGGYGIRWGEHLAIADSLLYASGKAVPLPWEHLRRFLSCRTMDTTEAGEFLNCTRQNIDDFVRKGRLKPVKQGKRSRLFLKSDLIRLFD